MGCGAAAYAASKMQKVTGDFAHHGGFPGASVRRLVSDPNRATARTVLNNPST